ncbi:MAG: biotin transporter BioY [Veillonellaceae bacterium]|nr:biotin transporter BioY [Veillonellaceae bacterium]
MKKMTLREMTLCALFIALVTIGAFIRIPVGTDVYTLQFLFTLLAGIVLGGRCAVIAIGVYVIMGLLGIPIFASGSGPAYVLQPTFGYLIGFIVQGYLVGKLTRYWSFTFYHLLGSCLMGMVLVYLFGISYFYFLSNYIIDAPISFYLVIWYCGVLQVVPDFLICLLASAGGLRFIRSGFYIK